MPQAEKGARGKGRQPLSPPQHTEPRSANSAPPEFLLISFRLEHNERLKIDWSWATQMKRFIDWRIFFITMGVASLLAFGLHVWVHLNVWVCLGIVVFGILLNGIIAMIEDEMPGGFNNPKPDDPSKKS